MTPEEPITHITRVFERTDGSQVKVTGTALYGPSLKPSNDFYVHWRPDAEGDWILLNDRPHPQWRTMSVDEYCKVGRPEMLLKVAWGEILSVTRWLGRPMSDLEACNQLNWVSA